MAITTIRVSDTEVQCEKTLYSFSQKRDADAFERCLADASIEACIQQCPAVSSRPNEQVDDPNRGSTISPSLGGMP
jgi:hypothetical protein